MIMTHKTPTGPLSTADILLLLKNIASARQEHFVVLTLDSGGCLIKKRVVFIGTINATLVHPRETFAPAIADYAACIVVAHNHPSGDPSPSRQDIETTQQLVAAGQILGVRLRDHIIVAGSEYYSFSANGMMLSEY
jgi:DNA repair protein RadC